MVQSEQHAIYMYRLVAGVVGDPANMEETGGERLS